jgi:hypothetical protein
VLVQAIPRMMFCINTDLPLPVDPAINVCGAFDNACPFCGSSTPKGNQVVPQSSAETSTVVRSAISASFL